MRNAFLVTICFLSVNSYIILAQRPHNVITETNDSSLLLRNSTTHLFSDPFKKDTFKIHLSGSSILSGFVRFEIINYQGKEIYSEHFESIYLLGYGLSDNSTVKLFPTL